MLAILPPTDSLRQLFRTFNTNSAQQSLFLSKWSQLHTSSLATPLERNFQQLSSVLRESKSSHTFIHWSSVHTSFPIAANCVCFTVVPGESFATTRMSTDLVTLFLATPPVNITGNTPAKTRKIRCCCGDHLCASQPISLKESVSSSLTHLLQFGLCSSSRHVLKPTCEDHSLACH